MEKEWIVDGEWMDGFLLSSCVSQSNQLLSPIRSRTLQLQRSLKYLAAHNITLWLVFCLPDVGEQLMASHQPEPAATPASTLTLCLPLCPPTVTNFNNGLEASSDSDDEDKLHIVEEDSLQEPEAAAAAAAATAAAIADGTTVQTSRTAAAVLSHNGFNGGRRPTWTLGGGRKLQMVASAAACTMRELCFDPQQQPF